MKVDTNGEALPFLRLGDSDGLEVGDLLLAVGSTLSVYPAAGVVPLAKQAGARILIVNGSATEMDAIADAVLCGNIGDLLPSLIPALH